jgi:hypothetical protein
MPFQSLAGDVRFGLRMLRTSGAVTGAAILSLALAVGACTAAFSLIDALVLRPLPVPEPERLVALSYPTPGPFGHADSFSYPLYERFRAASGAAVELFARTRSAPLQRATFDAAGAEPEGVRVQEISGDAFGRLGLETALGRGLLAADDRLGAPRFVAVLGDTFWRRRFGGDPSVLGRSLSFGGKRFEIVGVLERGFNGFDPGYLTDVYVPLSTGVRPEALTEVRFSWVEVWGRLAPGVTAERAREPLQAAFSSFRAEHAAELLPPGAPAAAVAAFLAAPLQVKSAATGGRSLFLLSFRNLLRVDRGFSDAGVLLITVDSTAPARGSAERDGGGVLGLLERARQLPGVEAAGLSEWGLVGGPFAPIGMPTLRFPGRGPDATRPYQFGISPSFLDTMKIRLLQGRDFEPRDLAPTAASVLVNEAFARHYFPGESALGKRFERVTNNGEVAQEIVGVIATVKYNELREAVAPGLFVPLRRLAGATLQVRSSDPMRVAPLLRREIPLVEPALRAVSVTLQSTRIANTLVRERLLAVISAFFGLAAAVLAAVGIYGVLSYSIVRRRREIGIRLALGARPEQVARLVVGDLAPAAVAGIAAGVAGGLVLARFLVPMLFEVEPSGWRELSIPIAVLLAAALASAATPALRAARVAPMEALRQE